MALQVLPPYIDERVALEGCDECKGDGCCNTEAYCSPASNSKGFLWEDSKVEEEDRAFYETDGKDVEKFADVNCSISGV